MMDLEIDLVSRRNVALVDLFDEQHAIRVLAAFGRAFEKLPESFPGTSSDQLDFLREAVTGLAEGGKVIPVRLALFAEMMKNRPWTRDELRTIGGASGVGIQFLEQSFSSSSAIPTHRVHAAAARRVLARLLPDTGSSIRGHMRSRTELAESAGYPEDSTQFDSLMHVLDTELKLLTPTESTEQSAVFLSGSRVETDCGEDSARTPNAVFYQLTHDYLVEPVQMWLTQSQKATRRGRGGMGTSAAWPQRSIRRMIQTTCRHF